MKLNFHKYLKVARLAVEEASNYLKIHFGKIKKMTHKKDRHYCIVDDINVNNIYETLLKKFTPEVGLYTEEGKRDISSDLIWVVDPLEGTSNFRVGIPFFATQICLLENKIPVLSILKAPILSQDFYAIRGIGTFLNNKKVFISNTEDLNKCLINIGKGTNKEDNIWYTKTVTRILPHVRTIRSLGSCGLELAYTASGKIDCTIYNGGNSYDYAPGVFLIREANGMVLNEKGNEWKFGDSYLLATNKILIKKFQYLYHS